MLKRKAPVRKPWTKEDLRELKAHSKARTPVAQVAKAMKRTEAALRQKSKDDWHRPWASALTATSNSCSVIGGPDAEQSLERAAWKREAPAGAAACRFISIACSCSRRDRRCGTMEARRNESR